MEDNNGTGDGDDGNGIDWIGSPVGDGCEVMPVAVGTGSGAVDPGSDGEGRISETTGSDAGKPPYPGMPYCRSGVVEYDRRGGVEGPGRLSTVAKRRDISAICRCMPWNMSPICRCMAAKAARESSRVGGVGGGGGALVAATAATDDAAAAAGAPEEAMVSDTKLLWLRDQRA